VKAIRSDGNKLFTDRLNAIIKHCEEGGYEGSNPKTNQEVIKAMAKNYGIAPATVRKWTTGSQPRDKNTRDAIMKRGKRLVKETIKQQTVSNIISPITLWDIAQFYAKMRLTDAGQLYLGYGKMERCFDGTKLDVSKLDDMIWVGIGGGQEPKNVLYWDYYKDDIIKYANIDAEICGQLARRSRDDYVKSNIRFKNTYSPANVGQQALMATDYQETINMVETDKRFRAIMEAGVESYHGGRFEVQRIGMFADMVGVDIVSAYWYVLYHLPSMISAGINDKGKKVESYKGVIIEGNKDDMELWDEWMKTREPFTIGFIDVEVEFPKGLNWYPLISQAKTTLIAPRLFKGKICAEEYEEMLLWNPVSVKTGKWIYHRVEEATYPFREVITDCLDKKCNSPKGSAEYATAKVVGSSLYGKTQQAIDGIMGGMYHPAYSAVITGATRARLAEICRLNHNTPAMMATDGLIFNKDDLKVIPPRPKCKVEAPNRLGEWEIEETGDCLIIGSGVYSFIKRGETEKIWVGYGEVEYTHPSYHKTTFRGTAKSFLLKSKYDNWYDFCVGFADDAQLSMERTRPQSLKEIGYKRRLSKARHEKDETQEIITYDEVNIFKEEPLVLNPCTESAKRVVPEKPKLFADLLGNQYTLYPHESVETANSKLRQVELVKEMLLELGI
jgi:hypothetical protein